MSDTMITLERIREITRQIAALFRPQKVILFGSHAYGKPTGDSDVDLLVLMETDVRSLHAAARIAAAIDHPFPLDIIIYTPSQFEDSETLS
ncbi:MAG: nucleotidyltransferase domain-containing protein [Anaerolineae bacterium]